MSRRVFTSTLLTLCGSSFILLRFAESAGDHAAYAAAGSAAPANPAPPSLENQYRRWSFIITCCDQT